MKMNKEKYEELMLRFALELHETGVTENMIELIKSQISRAPNLATASAQEEVSRFTYRHNGFLVEAKQTIDLVVKKCK